MFDQSSAAAFLLTCPLQELPEELSSIVEQYNFKTLTRDDAIEKLLKNHSRYLEQFVARDIAIQELIGLSKNIF